MERLRGWAEKREQKAEQSFNGAFDLVSGIAPGQPILVGHHSEKAHRSRLAKHDDRMRQGFEHREKSEQMRERAGNIAEQLDRSIYSDDPDAIEQLERRIAELESEREGIKAYNASVRRGEADIYLAPVRLRGDIGGCYMANDGTFPAYVMSNLGGNINRNRKRLAVLKRKQNAREGRNGGA